MVAQKHYHKENKHQKKKKSKYVGIFPLLLSAVIGIFMLAWYKGTNFITVDEDGNIKISAKRQAKLQKKLEELDNAEQYVLRADQNGYYPCHSCKDSTSVYLLAGQVWKYGVTTKTQKGRYPDTYLENNFLAYEIQFRGTLSECLKEEQRKIYQYAILPENLIRRKPLERPPGNKRDD